MLGVKERVQQSFARQKFMNLIGAQLEAVDEGSCTIKLPYSSDLCQQHGYFHAGVISTLADNAAGYAAYSTMSPTSSVLTVEFKLNLLAPGDGDLLLAKANVLKHGRTLTVCRSEVHVRKNGQEKLCAAAQCTLIELPDTADHQLNAGR